MSNNYQVLLLNSSFEVLGTMPLHQAMKKLMKSPSVLHVAEWDDDRTMKTFSGEYPVPSVVRLSYYLKLNWYKLLRNRDNANVSNLAVYRRDNFQCQYCGKTCVKKDISVDHILPKSRGGRNTAQNLVTACIKCNGRKGNRTPEEARMPLITPLRSLAESLPHFSLSQYVDDNPKWRKYIHYGEIDEKIETARHKSAA